MPTTARSPGTGQQPWAALRHLLDLLAQGAPLEHFARPTEEAKEANACESEVAAISEATQVALRIRRTLSQHRRREAELAALFDTAGDLAALSGR